MKNIIPFGIALFLSICFTPASFAETWTHSLGNCVVTSGNNLVREADRLGHNRLTFENEKNTGASFTCLLDMRSDKIINKVQVDFSADSTGAVTDFPADHAEMQYYLPKCAITFSYSPGGGDHFELKLAKQFSWGTYDQLILENPKVQHEGTGIGYLQSGILKCSTAYYSDVTRFNGLRITYAD